MNRRSFLKSLPFIAAAIPALRGLIEPAEAVAESELVESEPVAEVGPVYGLIIGDELIIGDDGTLYASGEFVNNIHLGGITSRCVAKWNTDAWKKIF